MSDNPNKKKLDGKRISQQPWEQAYQRRKNAVKEHLTSKNIAKKNTRRLRKPNALKDTAVLMVNSRKLESVLSKIESAVLQDPVSRGKVPFDFCKEWKQKGKPIFDMILVLFSFNAKVTSIIKRVMNGIDGVCGVPEPVGEM